MSVNVTRVKIDYSQYQEATLRCKINNRPLEVILTKHSGDEIVRLHEQDVRGSKEAYTLSVIIAIAGAALIILGTIFSDNMRDLILTDGLGVLVLACGAFFSKRYHDVNKKSTEDRDHAILKLFYPNGKLPDGENI